MSGRDNERDRETGAYWEAQFCGMARKYGKIFTPHQLWRTSNSAMFFGSIAEFGKSGWTLPDVTIWSAPGEHHEIKHKVPSFDGCYGLEWYRLDALARFANTTRQNVYYTIHDWSLAGATSGKEHVPNHINHWLVGDIAMLSQGCTRIGEGGSNNRTYYDGKLREDEIWYWTADTNRRIRWFMPLVELWTPMEDAA